MQNLNFLIKPASSQCNMRCRYCFYADEAAVRCGQSAAGMTRPEAETLIRFCLCRRGTRRTGQFFVPGR